MPAENHYPIGKLEAHQRNIPHKAISIFIYDQHHLLLQKRADNKYHSGGLWTNSVCSHPRWNESSADCAHRRLDEELGWTTELRHFGQIDYAAQVGQLFENEQVQCFHGTLPRHTDTTNFNRSEVSALRWMPIPEILEQIENQPHLYTEWFKIYMSSHRSMIESLIN